MKVLIDAQLPQALTGLFARAGFGARHVRAVGLLRATDDDLWSFAQREGCAIVSKDEDFAARWARGDRAVAIVWIRIGNCRSPEFIVRVQPHLDQIAAMLAAGETLIEVR